MKRQPRPISSPYLGRERPSENSAFPAHLALAPQDAYDAKCVFLSQRAPDERDRVYVSCSNWEVCDLNGRVQWPSPTLQTVYRSGVPLDYEEEADGSFGFVYRTWEVELTVQPFDL